MARKRTELRVGHNRSRGLGLAPRDANRSKAAQASVKHPNKVPNCLRQSWARCGARAGVRIACGSEAWAGTCGDGTVCVKTAARGFPGECVRKTNSYKSGGPQISSRGSLAVRLMIAAISPYAPPAIAWAVECSISSRSPSLLDQLPAGVCKATCRNSPSTP